MVRPGTVSPPDTPGSPDKQIVALVRDFQQAPYDCIDEKELHAKFFSLCRDAFPKYYTQDGQKVAAFRYQYETVWRYRQGDRFAQRHRNVGTTATFDFAILPGGFIRMFDYLTVANKDEQRRARLRCPPESEFLYTAWAVQCAIELKMASVHNALEATEGDVNRLEDRMLTACCKVAQEKVKQAYVVGLSRGPLPDLPRAHSMVASCRQLYQARYPDGNVCLVLATPKHTVLGGNWPEGIEFPNVAVLDGQPVSIAETT